MRALRPARIVVLSVLLALTALGVNLRTDGAASATGKAPLRGGFRQAGGWRCVSEIPMEQKVAEALLLDDFLFQSYQRDKAVVNLYVGYYHSAKKVGAAHDPLVCFQGQGWSIGQRESGTYRLASRPELSISYSSMVAERKGDKELIVYWFQVNDKAKGSTHSQKLAMLLDKISGRGEENAFVRLSAPLGAETPDAARSRIFQFVDDFYPQFLGYVSRAEKKGSL